MSRPTSLARRTVGQVVAGSVLALLLAPLLLLLGSTVSAGARRSACRRSTSPAASPAPRRAAPTPSPDVDVILTKPDGTTETQTTEDDGKFSFQVTESGDYLVGVDPETLPKGIEFGRRRAALRGEDDTLKVDRPRSSGGSTGPRTSTSAPPASTTRRARWTRCLQSAFNGTPPRTAAGAGLAWGCP